MQQNETHILILVVDDDALNRTQLAELLQQVGYQTVEACSGEEAIAYCSENQTDLVLMDIRMPSMDGFEATRQIKALPGGKFIPVIFVSGDDSPELVARTLESGGDDFVSKPVNPALLQAKINVLLRFKTLNDSLQGNIQQLEWELNNQRRTQEELKNLSNYDQLTGLPNRQFFLVYLEQVLHQAAQQGRRMALFMMDIAKFKRVNDVYGHVEGDQILLEVTRRLQTHDHEYSTVARMGGDHFVLLCENVHTEDDVRSKAEQVIADCSQPYAIDGEQLMLGINLGIAFFPNQGDSPESILRSAGNALEYSRQTGYNQYCFFESQMQEQTRAFHELDNSIHSALENGELELYYQPQVDSINRQIVGCEALLRWNHPNLGVISPGLFVPILEKEKLIAAVGEWVMREAIRQHLDWLERGFPGVRIAVNFSAMQLQESELADKVIEVIRDSGIAPPWLKLEITETAAIGNVEQVAKTLNKIRESGIQIAVDDFGTGYSSLNYLQRLPIDIVKIDRQFVKDIPFSKDDMTLVKAVIAMAHSMGLDVVAEGVETEEQARFLREQMCEELQGYLFSKPLPAHGFEEMLLGQSDMIVNELTMFPIYKETAHHG